MAERLIRAADDVLGQLASKVSKSSEEELKAASEDMKRILSELAAEADAHVREGDEAEVE